jgi:hypothetical protein
MAELEARLERLEARVLKLKAWQEGWDGPQWEDPTPGSKPEDVVK